MANGKATERQKQKQKEKNASKWKALKDARAAAQASLSYFAPPRGRPPFGCTSEDWDAVAGRYVRGRGALLSSQRFAVTVNAAGMLAFNRFKCWGSPAGLERGAVFADGSCYYRALHVVLVDIGREDCGFHGPNMLRARMAQYLEDHCLDQMPGSDDTLMERSLHAGSCSVSLAKTSCRLWGAASQSTRSGVG